MSQLIVFTDVEMSNSMVAEKMVNYGPISGVTLVMVGHHKVTDTWKQSACIWLKRNF